MTLLIRLLVNLIVTVVKGIVYLFFFFIELLSVKKKPTSQEIPPVEKPKTTNKEISTEEIQEEQDTRKKAVNAFIEYQSGKREDLQIKKWRWELLQSDLISVITGKGNITGKVYFKADGLGGDLRVTKFISKHSYYSDGRKLILYGERKKTLPKKSLQEDHEREIRKAVSYCNEIAYSLEKSPDPSVGFSVPEALGISVKEYQEIYGTEEHQAVWCEAIRAVLQDALMSAGTTEEVIVKEQASKKGLFSVQYKK